MLAVLDRFGGDVFSQVTMPQTLAGLRRYDRRAD